MDHILNLLASCRSTSCLQMHRLIWYFLHDFDLRLFFNICYFYILNRQVFPSSNIANSPAISCICFRFWKLIELCDILWRLVNIFSNGALTYRIIIIVWFWTISCDHMFLKLMQMAIPGVSRGHCLLQDYCLCLI